MHLVDYPDKNKNTQHASDLSIIIRTVLVAGAGTSIIFVAAKLFDKHVFVAAKPWSRQKLYLWQLPPLIEQMSILPSPESFEEFNCLY